MGGPLVKLFGLRNFFSVARRTAHHFCALRHKAAVCVHTELLSFTVNEEFVK